MGAMDVGQRLDLSSRSGTTSATLIRTCKLKSEALSKPCKTLESINRPADSRKTIVATSRPAGRISPHQQRRINSSLPSLPVKAASSKVSTPSAVIRCLAQAYGDDQVGALDERLKGFKLKKQDAEADRMFDLTYGEMLPEGVTMVLSPQRLIPSLHAKTLLDLGMGAGKFAMQAFLEISQLEHVVGVELTNARFQIAARALKDLAARNPGKFGCWEESCLNGRHLKGFRLAQGRRMLDFCHGDIFQVEQDLISKADVVILAVAFPPDLLGRVRDLLGRLKHGCRILTYEELGLDCSHCWEPPASHEFKQLPCNKHGECYPVSWIATPGHHFYLHEVGPSHVKQRSSSVPCPRGTFDVQFG